MKVSLRQRLKGKKISLYLDYYHQGIRKYEYLQLYLTPKPDKGNLSPAVNTENKKTLELAEKIRAKRFLEVQNNQFGFRDKEKLKGSFLEYFSVLTENKKESLGNYGNWSAVRILLKQHNPYGVTLERINKDWVESFKNYLDKKAKTKTGAALSLNSKYSYFNKLRAALKQAVKDGILTHNPSELVKPFPQDEVQREFLTHEELQRLAKTHCSNDTLKKMFLFSCITGLRWSDIEKLKWSEIHSSEDLGTYIRFRQKKTKGTETQPISEDARTLLGDEGGSEEKVFQGIKYGNWNKTILKDWLVAAGITRRITFHCARHTYATLQLTANTDIYTVSKLLGHRHLKTTEIYAKVIDKKKIEAANKIKISL